MPSPADTARTLVERYYAAFNRQDWTAMLDCLHDDVLHDPNQGVRETGRDAFARFLLRMEASYRERLHDIVVMASDDGRRAAAEYVVHGTYLRTDEGLPEADGQAYVLPGGAFFDVAFDDGRARIRRVTNYYNLPDWVRQVGG